MIPRRAAILMQVLAGANTILGSYASCLFQATVLRRGFFSADYHYYGDTAWFYRYLPGISLAYCPKPLARFVIHGTEIQRVVEKKRIYEMMLELAGALPEPEQAQSGAWWRLLVSSIS